MGLSQQPGRTLFSQYEAIADKAKCCRDTVYEAIKALEAADVLSLKSYPGLPHGMPTTHADLINADLLAFIRS
jgi:hypothetical protein